MKVDYNSVQNQEIKKEFVNREVYALVSGMVEYILNKSFEEGYNSDIPFTYDDVENFYIDNSEKIEELEEEYQEIDFTISAYENDIDDEVLSIEQEKEVLKQLKDLREKLVWIENRIDELEYEQETPQEVYEWWIVSEWLGRKLKEKGYPVIDSGYNTIWGRTTTGQAILLDYVISSICEDMEILEGQENDWSKV